jgi:hypothetical protein
MAEIRIAVFRLHRPIIGDGIFDAAAKSVARAGDRYGRVGARNAGEESGRIGVTGVEACGPSPNEPLAKLRALSVPEKETLSVSQA